MVSSKSKAYRNVTNPIDESLQMKITTTPESKKILSYNCTKTVISTDKLEQTFWTTEEIKDIELKGLTRQSVFERIFKETLFYEAIKGVPLRIEIATQRSTIIYEVTDITPVKLSDADFAIQPDWKEYVTIKN